MCYTLGKQVSLEDKASLQVFYQVRECSSNNLPSNTDTVAKTLSEQLCCDGRGETTCHRCESGLY